MEYGAHLPLIDFGTGPSLRGLKEYARAAAALDYRYLCANDHLLFARPWLDGPTALAAVIEESGGLALATTISLPVIRGPVQLAKTLAAIDVLSEGRLVVGVGPGSSAADYAAVRVPFDERRKRFDETLGMLRALLEGDGASFEGEFYSTQGIVLEPRPAQRPRPLSGSPAGALARVCGWSRITATAGSPRPTTRRQICSAPVSAASPTSCGSRDGLRSHSRTRSRPPGSTSRRTRTVPSAS